jgi:arylformamidase
MFLDISPTISARLGVWPGDTKPSRKILLDLAKGDNITLSSLTATVHLGAHADAPSHYGKKGDTIETRDLSLYIGPCQVIRMPADRKTRIEPDGLPPITDERVLIYTGSFPDPEDWNDDFAALSPKLVDFLHEKGVRLVGIDTPSVDLQDSKDLPAHKAFLKHDMAILEGLVLKDVLAGRYELIAVPLKLEGFDASPVRAVLRSLQ